MENVIYSHFSYCTIGTKDPPKPAAPVVRCFLRQSRIGGSCHVHKTNIHTIRRILGNDPVFPVLSMQKESKSVSGSVYLVFVLHSTFAAVRRGYRRNQLCPEYGSFILPGKQECVSEGKTDVLDHLPAASDDPVFYMGRMVVGASGDR